MAIGPLKGAAPPPPPARQGTGLPTRAAAALPQWLRRWAVEAEAVAVGLIPYEVNRLLAPKPRDTADAAGRALASWSALRQSFRLPGLGGVYLGDVKNPFQVADVWPYGQALGAALDMARLTGDERPAREMMRTLSLYAQDGAYAPRMDGPARRFFDDNGWLGLDLMQAYAQTGDRAFLHQAQTLFGFIQQGTQMGAHPGTLEYWEEGGAPEQRTRSTCSTGPAMELALRLALATRGTPASGQYLAFAKRLNTALHSTLRSPEGLYWDNVSDAGGIDKALYSYNQGTPLGADVLFYRLTGDQRYLADAAATAHAALAYFTPDRLWTQPPAFNAIFFRNLLALDAVQPDPRYRQALGAYLDRVWKDARDPSTGLFMGGGIGAYEGSPGNLVDQGALTQLFALRARPNGLDVVA